MASYKTPARLLLSNSIAIVVTSYLIAGLQLQYDIYTIGLAAFVLCLTHVFIEPLLNAISFPINVMTLGFFHLVINALLLYLTTYFVQGMQIVGGKIFTDFITVLAPEVSEFSVPWYLMLVIVAVVIRFLNIILKLLVF